MLASWGTVVPIDVSGVALAEHVESALDFDELLPSQDANLLARDLECMLRPLLQLDLLNKALEAATQKFEAKFLNYHLKCHIVKLGLHPRSTQGVFSV